MNAFNNLKDKSKKDKCISLFWEVRFFSIFRFYNILIQKSLVEGWKELT